MWRHYDTALWRHVTVLDIDFFLTTASNVNFLAAFANHVTRLWQAGDTENFQRRITG